MRRRGRVLPSIAMLVACALAIALWLALPRRARAGLPLSVRARLALTMAAAARGDPNAQFALGEAYSRGQLLEPDLASALDWYERAAAQGHHAAQFALGETFFRGRQFPPEPLTAVRWWTAAAEAGHFDSQYRLADIYSRGLAVPLSPHDAVKWWSRMAEAGDTEARRRLAWAYSTGWGTERRTDLAVAIWRPLAELGDAQALERLGRAYATGDGVPANSRKAVELWQRTCAQPGGWVPDCAYDLCLAYAKGQGVERAPLTACRWCRLVGADYTLLGPTPRLESEADPQRLPWFVLTTAETRRRAAEARAVLGTLQPEVERLARSGDQEARYEVGIAYLSGIGRELDRCTGRLWLARAAEQGHGQAREALSREEANERNGPTPGCPTAR